MRPHSPRLWKIFERIDGVMMCHAKKGQSNVTGMHSKKSRTKTVKKSLHNSFYFSERKFVLIWTVNCINTVHNSTQTISVFFYVTYITMCTHITRIFVKYANYPPVLNLIGVFFVTRPWKQHSSLINSSFFYRFPLQFTYSLIFHFIHKSHRAFLETTKQ